MRKIHKTPVPPKSLRELQMPPKDMARDTKSKFRADVKRQLSADQNAKCAYCECRLNGDFGHIEHFRPKRGYTTARNRHISKPGYYWLARDWNNMLLSCSTCNTAYKKNRFDLRDEATRDIPSRDISREQPLLVNPLAENPADFIVYKGCKAIPRTIGTLHADKGRYTIDLLGLNRPALLRARRSLWLHFLMMRRIRHLALRGIISRKPIGELRNIARLLNAELRRMQSPDAEYSAMLTSQYNYKKLPRGTPMCRGRFRGGGKGGGCG